MTKKKVYKELLCLVDLARDKVDENIKSELNNNYGHVVIDEAPKDLSPMKDVVGDFLSGEKYLGGETVLCSIPISHLWSDPTYNRPDEIDYNKCAKNIRDVGGYSNNAADILSAFLRPDAKIVTTKGNHRATMRYLCGLDPTKELPISLKLHKRHASLEEMVIIESKDHNRDCSYRAPQKGDSKFKSAYYAEENWAESLYEFCKQFSIDIAGTLPESKFHLPSHSYVDRARRRYKDPIVEKFLKAFTERNCSKIIYGNTIMAGSHFLNRFGGIISQVDKKFHVDSFSDMLDFYFNRIGPMYQPMNCNASNLKQEQITDATVNNSSPDNEAGVARFVFLYNDFCGRYGYELKGSANTVIPFDGSEESEWNKFKESCNPFIRTTILQFATTQFFKT